MYRLFLISILTLISFPVVSAQVVNRYPYYQRSNAHGYYNNRMYANNSVWQNIGNYFRGRETGFTPPVDYNYNSGYYNNSSKVYIPSEYENSSYTDFSSPLGRQERIYRNTGSSSGSRVTILD